MGYVPTVNPQSRAAAQAIIELLGYEQFRDDDYAIELRIMEHCFPQEYEDEMKKTAGGAVSIRMCLATAAQLENDGIAPAGFMNSVMRERGVVLNGQTVILDNSAPEGEQLHGTEIPVEALRLVPCPRCGINPNFHGEHAMPMPEYACALLQLWASIKNKAAWRVGYSAEFAAAVERLREMEGQELADATPVTPAIERLAEALAARAMETMVEDHSAISEFGIGLKRS